ncbi:hypothetical protein FK513_30940, partial [Klebsiella pneumoniae]|nr:hypothetical protein [Klebsiella pneumoniae]
YGMSKEGLAPKSFQRIASNGVPWMTVVVMGGALLLNIAQQQRFTLQGLQSAAEAGSADGRQ